MVELPRWSFPGWPSPAALERQAAVEAFGARDRALTKPAGSLGLLEALGRRLAYVQRDPRPQARPAACLVFASDHPVAALGVSAYPIGVTRAMVANFVRGGGAASVLCERARVPLHVIDVGVALAKRCLPSVCARPAGSGHMTDILVGRMLLQQRSPLLMQLIGPAGWAAARLLGYAPGSMTVATEKTALRRQFDALVAETRGSAPFGIEAELRQIGLIAPQRPARS